MNALQHLSPVTLSGQLFDGGILIVCVLCVVVMWIAWGPEWREEARTWLPRDGMPPVVRVRFPRSFTQPAAKQGDWKARYGMRSPDGDGHARTSLGPRAAFVQPLGMHAAQSEAGSEPAASLSYTQSATVIPIASRRAK